ncbi:MULTISPECIES: DUF6375 family protein [Sinorhizobium/Ensifer group]|uniref:DUF6375 family protein n=1 Tax=Sinorhizobium/Ensifer group TaxID=227292 RepID=UPI00040CFC0F|nr:MULTISPECIES: DUF6375 family protein [Sinorhizobium/Ensifer group]
MKIWNGYGSEHSANLVIIGKFADASAARDNLALFNEAIKVAQSDYDSGKYNNAAQKREFSDAMMDLYRRTQLSLGYTDPEQLIYEFNAKQDGNKVIITTEENDINAVIKILLHGNAKIEVYSAHDHDSIYGRQTRS